MNSLNNAGSDSSIVYYTVRTWSNYATLKDLKPGTTYDCKPDPPSKRTILKLVLTPTPNQDRAPKLFGRLFQKCHVCWRYDCSKRYCYNSGDVQANGNITHNERDINKVQPDHQHTIIGPIADAVEEYDFAL